MPKPQIIETPRLHRMPVRIKILVLWSVAAKFGYSMQLFDQVPALEATAVRVLGKLRNPRRDPLKALKPFGARFP